MRRLLYFCIIAILAFYSCDSRNSKASQQTEVHNEKAEDGKISIVGKWYRWSKENGYSEYHIDPQYVVVFNEKMGRSKLEYKIENNTFKYLTIDYAATITSSGDTAIVLQDGDRIATLTRFKQDFFERIPEESDAVRFEAYVEGFNERADLYPKVTNFMENVMPAQQ